MAEKPTYEDLEKRIQELMHAESERKQAEDALKESEKLYHKLFDSSKDAIMTIEPPTWKFTSGNHAIIEMFKVRDEKEFTSLGPWDVSPENQPDGQSSFEKAKKMIQIAMEEGSNFFEWTHKRVTGEKFPATVFLTKVKLEDRTLLQATVRDITERKQAEKVREKLQTQLSNALEMARLGHWEYDVANDLFTFNDQFYNIFRTTVKQVGGYTMSSAEYAGRFVHPDDIHIVGEEIRKVIEGADPNIRRQLEHRMIYADGTVGYISVQFFIVNDDQGKTIKTYGVNQDITERKLAEVALRKSENRFRDITHSMADWVWEVDKNGKYTFVSDTVKTVLGYSSEELIGKTPFDLMSAEEGAKISEIFSEIVAKSRPIIDLENWNIAKDGTEVCFLTNGVPIMDADRKLQGYRGVDKDITNQKKLEAEKSAVEAQLQQAQKMESIGNLAGGIAHDFNNILSVIIGFTELTLEEVEKGSIVEENLQEVYTAGKRAKDLVKQILAFARQAEEEIKPIQVDTIAKEIVKFIRSSIPTTIKIKNNIQSNSLIMGNATQVHQIFMNLFTNAAHAMEDEGGILEVGLKDVFVDNASEMSKTGLEPGDYIEIKVSDTGTGIPPDVIGFIFEPYYTTKPPGEGTGMGLSVVHGIVESYGGKITVDSELGKGATFSIYLPLTKKRGKSLPYESETLPTGTDRILFVDDELPIARIGSQALERLGYSVTIRTSSVEALELFRSKPNDFDLVITDMTMPNMTGDKLADELMKIRFDIPIILCTGYSKKISDGKATEIGIKAFAYKPIVMADLAKTVRKVLDAGRSEA